MTRKIYDLFAGPGGWDMGARAIGLDPIGFEWDDAACATRRTVGLKTMQCDVSEVDFGSGFDQNGLWGLIASPPCQAWSMAGKGGGRRDKEHVVACALELAAGNDTRAHHAEQCEDPRSILVVEPLRWALHFRPRWLAFEQVPPVLELWTMFAEVLRSEGYSVWAGVLEAERYGVPQTRERAVLLGSLDGPVHPPAPTHQRYIPGEAPRHEITLEGEVLPWVSMAQALGWQEGPSPSPSPSPSVTGGGGATGGVEIFASKAARSRAAAAVAMGMNNDRPERKEAGAGNQPRPADKPAATLDSTTRQAVWMPTHYDRRQGNTLPSGERVPARPIPVEEPAPTVASDGLAKGHDVWVQRERSGDRAEEGFDPQQEPCQTLTSKARSWTVHRPSTTLAGDPRVFPPGGHIAHDGRDNSQMVGRSENAVRVTQEQAAILQTFPADYPWQGSRSKQFEQIGNAVPPLLAEHVLSAVTGIPMSQGRASEAA